MRILLAVIIIGVVVVLYIRQFEKSNIYFPSRTIELTPEVIGLEYEDVYFKTSDGTLLNAWFIPVANARGTVLFFHGNAGNIGNRIDILRVLNSLGLNVFIFDYRGYGKSKGSPSEKGTYLDGMAAYEYLVNERQIAPDNIVIYGKSLGGAIAIDVASKVKCRVMISDSTFSSIVDMAKEIYPFLPVKLFGTIKYDSVSKVGNINVPKLIIHSTEDEIVPLEHGERLFKAADQPKELYKMKGGHNDSFMIYEDEYSSKIDKFLRENGI